MPPAVKKGGTHNGSVPDDRPSGAIALLGKGEHHTSGLLPPGLQGTIDHPQQPPSPTPMFQLCAFDHLLGLKIFYAKSSRTGVLTSAGALSWLSTYSSLAWENRAAVAAAYCPWGCMQPHKTAPEPPSRPEGRWTPSLAQCLLARTPSSQGVCIYISEVLPCPAPPLPCCMPIILYSQSVALLHAAQPCLSLLGCELEPPVQLTLPRGFCGGTGTRALRGKHQTISKLPSVDLDPCSFFTRCAQIFMAVGLLS